MAIASLRLLSLAALLAVSPSNAAQQAVDGDYKPQIKKAEVATYSPVVKIDSAHANFHTLEGRYAPLATLLVAGGFEVGSFDASFSPDTLSGLDVLIISNARGDEAKGAFSPGEIAAVKNWVERGGALLLIADHAPFGDSAAPLSGAFGVPMGNGYVVTREDGVITSQIDFKTNMLGSHPIISGGEGRERIRHVRSYTGQSLTVPEQAIPLLIFPPDALEVGSSKDVQLLRQGNAVSGSRVGKRAQAVALTFGAGRVVIAGDAAMFTVQRVSKPGGRSERTGLTAFDNEQFALNVVRWLAGNLRENNSVP